MPFEPMTQQCIWSATWYDWMKMCCHGVPDANKILPLDTSQPWGDTSSTWQGGDCIVGSFPGGIKLPRGNQFEDMSPKELYTARTFVSSLWEVPISYECKKQRPDVSQRHHPEQLWTCHAGEAYWQFTISNFMDLMTQWTAAKGGVQQTSRVYYHIHTSNTSTLMAPAIQADCLKNAVMESLFKIFLYQDTVLSRCNDLFFLDLSVSTFENNPLTQTFLIYFSVWIILQHSKVKIIHFLSTLKWQQSIPAQHPWAGY